MSKQLTEYGLPFGEYQGLVLEDPALFDGYMVRMVEDLDLSAQVTAGLMGVSTIVVPVVSNSLASIRGVNASVGRDFPSLEPAQFGEGAPGELRSYMQSIARTYVRGPLAYDEAALAQVGNVVAAVAYDFLATGSDQARAEGTTTVKLRHFLPACDRWLYPFNRFC